MIPWKWAVPIGLIVLGVFIGLTGGWLLWKPKQVPPVKAMPEIRQADKSLVLKTEPTANPKPAQQIPKGAKVERTITATILPIPTAGQETPGSGSVQVDLSLIRLPDQTERAVISSPNGEVIKGVDMPRQVGPPIPKQLRNAAGLGYSRNQWSSTKMIVGERDYGFLRIGGHVGVTEFKALGVSKTCPDIGLTVLIRF